MRGILKKTISKGIVKTATIFSVALATVCAINVTVKAETYGDFEYEVAYQNEGEDKKAVGIEIVRYRGDSTVNRIVTVPDSFDVSVSEVINGHNIESIKTLDVISVGGFNDRYFEVINLPSRLKKIKYAAFAGCSKLKIINIPDTVTDMEDWSLSSCDSLESITIPAGVTVLKDRVFSGNTKLEKITIPANVTSIYYSAFSDCTNLKEVTFKTKILESIGTDAFKGCSSLKNISLPNSLRAMGNSTFANCTALEDIKLPDTVEFLGSETFSGDVALKKVDFPKNLYCIHNEVFSGCSALKEVSIPSGLTWINVDSFKGCNNLKEIEFKGTLEEWEKIEKRTPNEDLNRILIKCTNGYYHKDHIVNLNINIKKATTKSDGKIVKKCLNCKDVAKEEIIKKISEKTLKDISVKYNGKVQKANIVIKDTSGVKLKEGTDYSVKAPKGRKKIGNYKYTITFKGNYSGNSTITFTIRPKKTEVQSLEPAGNKIKVKWKKAKNISGYQVVISSDKNFKKAKKIKTIKDKNTTDVTFKNLKTNKKYYCKIRVYTKVNNKKIYSNWSKVKMRRI